MGTKSINNTGASIADFVYKQGIDNVCIFEIKTPKTTLIEDDKYRTNVYSPSKELISAVVQIKEQKDSFMKNYYGNKVKSAEQGVLFSAFDPKCYLILGNASKLNQPQLKSFNLFRNELRNVEIITYDELAHKIENLYNLLGGNHNV